MESGSGLAVLNSPALVETDESGSGANAPVAPDRRQDVRHATVGAGTNFLAILAGLSEAIFHPLAAHLFGTSFYGLYRWGISSAEPLLRLSPLGTDKGVIRHLASHRVSGEAELEKRSLRTAFWLTLGASRCWLWSRRSSRGRWPTCKANPRFVPRFAFWRRACPAPRSSSC